MSPGFGSDYEVWVIFNAPRGYPSNVQGPEWPRIERSTTLSQHGSVVRGVTMLRQAGRAGSVGNPCSSRGSIARAGGTVDWLFRDADDGSNEFIASVGAVVMGRKTVRYCSEACKKRKRP